MRNVADILKRKGSHVETVQSELTVIDALKLMADKNIGSVAISQNDRFIGLMTERDYSRKVILKGRSSSETTVGEIMDTNYPSVVKNDTVEHCMELMSAKNIRYLPVIENEQLAGIVSINDVVKETILTQKETIEHLQNYIHS
ncbi:CBS domain-containing protein [Parafilimonas terrae]|jgi:CBS domain-containing protein|uniref:CBS domain-containing protein n=1 Tax=Parafilimonas terrae TaxID=1465490 RepID=A0A1I5XMC1_9BACT|nr:CBS domain-containing protein [Parafilimonas terrae]SFQ32867.1 CBS domain-containing protein [Parafilimonas terrae]